MFYKGAIIDPARVSFFLNEVNVLIDKGFKEEIDNINKVMQEGRIVKYLIEKYPNDFDVMEYYNSNDKTSEARIEGISILLRDFSECYHGNERRKWGLENNGLCVVVSWCAGIMSDWKTYEEILQKAELNSKG